MQDIIVFVPSDIDSVLRGKIMDFLVRNNIQKTNHIDEATVIITKEKIENTLDDIFNKLQTKPFELRINPIDLPIIQKPKIKHIIQRNINIKRFNKTKQFNKQTIFNRYKHR